MTECRRCPSGPLAEALEPYLWLDQITPVQAIGRRGMAGKHWCWHEITGIVKMQGEPVPQPEPADQEESYIRASAVRESLMRTANTAITAAEGAGYRHTRHPEIDVTGDLQTHYREPWKPDLLCCEVKVRMWLAEV